MGKKAQARSRRETMYACQWPHCRHETPTLYWVPGYKYGLCWDCLKRLYWVMPTEGREQHLDRVHVGV